MTEPLLLHSTTEPAVEMPVSAPLHVIESALAEFARLRQAPPIPLEPFPEKDVSGLTVFTDGTVLRWVQGSAPLLDGTVRRFAEGFAAFLADGTVMGETERALVLANPIPDPPGTHTLLDLVAHQVATRPDAVAVRGEHGDLTFAELDRRASGLAVHIGQQAGPVVVAMEKSADLIVALLAVLRTGSYYLPLAPEHVATRLDDLVRRSGATAVLTEVPADLPDRTACPAVTPESLAYVMPTSGTTGVPKLVGVPHRAVVRLVHRNATIPLGPTDRTMLVATTSFDAATLEVWGALANGGTIVVPRPGELADPYRLCDTIEREGITTGFFTVTLFARMVEAGPGRLAGMRHVIVGGEAVPPRLFADAERAVPRHILVNGYGPTENTTFSCCYRLDRDPSSVRSLPIGAAMHGSRAHVVDEDLRPLPVGATGEIIVAGAGLAVGYLNDPALTAQRFPAHPWASGARVFRTGDRGRLLPDGTIEYLGRDDRQVKVRGYRVELGEVERVLDAHPDVVHTIAFTVDTPSGRQLAAGVETRATEADLRSWLAERVPPYLVPSRLYATPTLPLTPNGKVDVAALRTQRQVAAGSPLERTLATVWSTVLGLDGVGVDDDLMSLGADSVAVLAVTTRLTAELRRPVPAHVVFESTTVRALARALAPASLPTQRAAMSPTVSVRPVDIRRQLRQHH